MRWSPARSGERKSVRDCKERRTTVVGCATSTRRNGRHLRDRHLLRFVESHSAALRPPSVSLRLNNRLGAANVPTPPVYITSVLHGARRLRPYDLNSQAAARSARRHATTRRCRRRQRTWRQVPAGSSSEHALPILSLRSTRYTLETLRLPRGVRPAEAPLSRVTNFEPNHGVNPHLGWTSSPISFSFVRCFATRLHTTTLC